MEKKRREAVRIRLLGGFRVSVGSRTVGNDRWRLKKAKGVVKLLAFLRRQPSSPTVRAPTETRKPPSNRMRSASWGFSSIAPFLQKRENPACATAVQQE